MKRNIDIRTYNFTIEGTTLYLCNALLISNVGAFTKELFDKLKVFKYKLLEINIDELERIDSIGVATLNYVEKKLAKRNIEVQITGGNNTIKKKLLTFSQEKSLKEHIVERPKFFETLGDSFFSFLHDYLKRFITLTANILYWSVVDIFHSKRQRKGEFYNQAVLIGVNAVWIVMAMSFIIGLVLAIQSASQLRNLGANIYIVDLTVIAMMSEMGPLITAILVAGRSGSSIAAEIATMKVTSETDALKTMGLNPVRFIVIPKMHGSIVTLPFLTILANILGIFGGMVVAYFYLDIGFQVFINRMTESLYNRDIIIGIVKSLVFACIIVLTGSFFGLMVNKGAEGVGKVTTQAVVVSISLVFIADSIMGLLFY